MQDWLLDFPAGLSLLDVEAARSSLNAASNRSPTIARSLYYERKSTFMYALPPSQRGQFVDGQMQYGDKGSADFVMDDSKAASLVALKSKIAAGARASGMAALSALGYDFDASGAAAGGKSLTLGMSADPLTAGFLRWTTYTCAYKPKLVPTDVMQVRFAWTKT